MSLKWIDINPNGRCAYEIGSYYTNEDASREVRNRMGELRERVDVTPTSNKFC